MFFSMAVALLFSTAWRWHLARKLAVGKREVNSWDYPARLNRTPARKRMTRRNCLKLVNPTRNRQLRAQQRTGPTLAKTQIRGLVMFRSLLVPLDRTPESAAAVPLALDI